MFYTLWSLGDDVLVTIGDAVASFLQSPDDFTVNRCMLNKTQLLRMQWHVCEGQGGAVFPDTFAESGEERKRHWSSAASMKRWLTSSALIATGLLVSTYFLWRGISFIAYQSGVKAAFKTGFGTADPRAMVQGLRIYNIIPLVLLANLPQMVCSLLYFVFNALVTSMLQEAEWNRYYLQKKALRVSNPTWISTEYLLAPATLSVQHTSACNWNDPPLVHFAKFFSCYD